MFYRFLCFIIFFALSPSHWAQKDSAMQISQKQWQEISEGIDYSENFKEEPKEPKKNSNKTFVTNGSTSNFSGLKYVFYFIVVALVVFLIIRIFGNFKSNTSVKEKAISINSMREIEENIHEVNLESLLKEALLNKNYKIALRLNFLIIIKLLSQKNKIEWAKEKTNWEYYSELNDILLADQFKEIIISFETFWYGEHPLTENQYLITEPTYQAFQKRLSPNE